MEFQSELVEARILKRYKRFLADVLFDSGQKETVHVANTGPMTSCWAPGQKVILSHHSGAKRKYAYTLEMVHNGQTWIGVNTHMANKIVAEAIEEGQIPAVAGFPVVKREVVALRSRIDFAFESAQGKKCYMEVKSVTLKGAGDLGLFPDAVSKRGLKHLEDLTQLVQQGHRAIMFYLVQRQDIKRFRAAEEIDPDYAAALNQAREAGVEVLIYSTQLSPKGIKIASPIPYCPLN